MVFDQGRPRSKDWHHGQPANAPSLRVRCTLLDAEGSCGILPVNPRWGHGLVTGSRPGDIRLSPQNVMVSNRARPGHLGLRHM